MYKTYTKKNHNKTTIQNKKNLTLSACSIKSKKNSKTYIILYSKYNNSIV